MGSRRRREIFFVILASFLLLSAGECKKKKKKPVKKPEETNVKETSLFNFMRLVVFRLIYGFATMFGAQESVSEFMGGIFVPPGADDYDDVGGDYRDYFGEDYRDSDSGYDY